MKRFLSALAAIAVVVSAGVVHGRLTNRWRTPPDLERAAARLARVPAQLGRWQGHPQVLGPEFLKAAGIDGYLWRRYVSRDTGDGVAVLLVCGRLGPISAHTPLVCYPAVGFEPEGEPVSFPVGAGNVPRPDRFLAGLFVKHVATGPVALRVFWSWKADGPWEAPRDPRWAFAPRSALYKLYVIEELKTPDRRIRPDQPAVKFLTEELLPALDASLRDGA